jgi:hypothetical protein
MNAQARKLQAAESDLKQLMADVSLAMEKAQEAVARITSKAAAAPLRPPDDHYDTDLCRPGRAPEMRP